MIIFSRTFLQKIILAMKIRRIETCGIGNFIKSGKDYIVSDFKWSEYVGRQDPSMSRSDLASSASVTHDPKIIHEYNSEKSANVAWHSHSNFGVFWSGTDERCIKKWIGQELLSIVTNLNGDILIRFDKAFLSGIETQELFRGNLKQLPTEMKVGKKLTEQERAEFICLLKKNTIDNSTSYANQFHRLQSSEQEESVPLLPWF